MALNQKIVSPFLLILALLMGNSVYTYHNYQRLNSNNEWVVHTQQVLVAVDDIRSLVNHTNDMVRFHFTQGKKSTSQDFEKVLNQTLGALDAVKQMTKENPLQEKNEDLMIALLHSQDALLRQLAVTPAQKGYTTLRDEISDYSVKIRDLLSVMRKEEDRLLGLRTEETADSIKATGISFGLELILALIFIFLNFILLTQRIRAEAALRESENNYHKAVEAIKDFAISVVDPQGRIVTWNEGAERINGYKRTEILGKGFPILYIPEDVKADKPQRLLKMAAENDRVEDEGWHVRKDGSRFLADVVITSMRDEKGELRGFVKITRDVTERKKAENEVKQANAFLNTVLENLPNMVFVKDAKDLRFVMFNKAGEELLGIPRADLIGKNDYDFFPQEEADFFTSKDRKVLGEGKLLDIPEETLQTRDKGPRTLHTKKIPVLDAEGKPQYLLGISEDITEQKEREKMKIYTQALETSNRELQDFVFVASHDLQEPLRKIQAFGEFLRDEFKEILGETGRDYVERMRSAANRMQTLINDLLALTRVTTKAQPFVPVNLSEILQGVLSDLETRIQEKKAKVEVGALPTLEADATQMRQLFQNLIANALKFQRAGAQPEIKITASKPSKGVPNGGTRCRITVEDNGIGFDNKYVEQIFKVFERLHGRDEYEGTGIGLAICRKVVERHGGTIQAEGVPGKGSRFTVELPLRQKM
jgi:PAS domain S-box-containing protein